jgi:hypothetical protein
LRIVLDESGAETWKVLRQQHEKEAVTGGAQIYFPKPAAAATVTKSKDIVCAAVSLSQSRTWRRVSSRPCAKPTSKTHRMQMSES